MHLPNKKTLDLKKSLEYLKQIEYILENIDEVITSSFSDKSFIWKRKFINRLSKIDLSLLSSIKEWIQDDSSKIRKKALKLILPISNMIEQSLTKEETRILKIKTSIFGEIKEFITRSLSFTFVWEYKKQSVLCEFNE